MIHLNRHLWQRFSAIAAPYWFREEKWQARALLTLLVCLLLGQTGFAVLFNENGFDTRLLPLYLAFDEHLIKVTRTKIPVGAHDPLNRHDIADSGLAGAGYQNIAFGA